jgi:hypothetical protein
MPDHLGSRWRLPGGSATDTATSAEEWRREAAHRMVFGTMTVDPGDARADGDDRLLSNRANDHLSAREGGAKSPVDLLLRLDDADASPTPPQANIGKH